MIEFRAAELALIVKPLAAVIAVSVTATIVTLFVMGKKKLDS